jgi:hypothetical protein
MTQIESLLTFIKNDLGMQESGQRAGLNEPSATPDQAYNASRAICLIC